jgi:hypothetical protein
MMGLGQEWRETPIAAKTLIACGILLILFGLVAVYLRSRSGGLIMIGGGGCLAGLGNIYGGYVWRKRNRVASPDDG